MDPPRQLASVIGEIHDTGMLRFPGWSWLAMAPAVGCATRFLTGGPIGSAYAACVLVIIAATMRLLGWLCIRRPLDRQLQEAATRDCPPLRVR